MKSRACLILCLSVAAGSTPAAEDLADKRGYSWVTPVPDDKMREMSTDRPDATESPFTIDAGHVQLEMDLGNYARDSEGGVRETVWEAAPFNLRFGLTQNFEAGFFVVPYREESEEPDAGGTRTRRSGFGDTMLRAKWNFSGNDSGDFGSGVILDLKLPTARDGMSNEKYEGAITFPIAFALGGGWEAAAMTSLEAVYSDVGEHRAVWSNTITAGHDLSENVSGFVELTSSTGDGSHVATFNCGLARPFGANVQFDTGLVFGLSSTAPDLAVFAGLSQRF